MEWREFIRTWQGVKLENWISRVTIPFLAVSVALLAYLQWTHEPVVVLEPPAPLDEQAEITANEASPQYQMAWGLWVAELIGNVHPGNHGTTLDQLNLVLTAQTADDVRSDIVDQIHRLRDDDATVRFDAQRVDYREGPGRVVVTGEQTLIGAGAAEQSERRTYEVTIGMDRYRPQLLDIFSYEGGAMEEHELEEWFREQS